MSEPTRHPLLAELSGGLRPSAQQAQELTERVQRSVGVPLQVPSVAADPVAAGTAAAGLWSAWKGVGVALLLVGGGVTGITVQRMAAGGTQPTAVVAPVASTAPSHELPTSEPVPETAAELAPETPEGVPEEPAPSPAEEPSKRSAPPARAVPSAAAAPAASAIAVAPAEPIESSPAESSPTESIQSAEPTEAARLRDERRAQERALIDRARTELLGGDAMGAYVTLSAHAQQFPNGTLSEEREALAVQALARGGQVEAAKKRRERFEQRWPRSLFLPSVRSAAP